MNPNSPVALVTALLVASPSFAAETTTLDAATRLGPKAAWRTDSAILGDFTCQGIQQHAIFGTTQSEVVVAVFTRSLNKKPDLLRFASPRWDSPSMTLTTESLDFQPDDFKQSLGAVPDGMKSSKTCKGLNLGDGETDSMHIYWNHKDKRFSAWSL